jgi:hypothetical protein
MAGETVSLTITPDAGFTVTSGSPRYNDGTSNTTISGISFLMPSNDITAGAVFEPIGLPVFTITKLARPNWSWTTSADGKNSGHYRYKLDSAASWSYTSASSYTPSWALSDGNHTLTLEELNKAGDWSSAVTCSFNIDTALSGYHDSGNCSAWANEAVKWAVEHGILQDYNGLLNPQAPTTRAEGAAIIQRFLVNVLGAKT